MGFLRRLFCKHDYEWASNVYGEEINMMGGKRSWWRCKRCGKYQLRDHLYEEAKVSDVVESPDHYAGDGRIECMDAMRSMLHGSEQEPIVTFWWANAFKYLWRWHKKNGAQDLKKAKRCIEYVLRELGEDE